MLRESQGTAHGEPKGSREDKVKGEGGYNEREFEEHQEKQEKERVSEVDREVQKQKQKQKQKWKNKKELDENIFFLTTSTITILSCIHPIERKKMSITGGKKKRLE